MNTLEARLLIRKLGDLLWQKSSYDQLADPQYEAGNPLSPNNLPPSNLESKQLIQCSLTNNSNFIGSASNCSSETLQDGTSDDAKGWWVSIAQLTQVLASNPPNMIPPTGTTTTMIVSSGLATVLAPNAM